MKKKIKILAGIICCAVLCITSLFNALADTASVNGHEVKAGDTVTYIMYMQDSPYPISGVHMYVFFDSSLLKPVPQSENSEGFKNAIINTDVNVETTETKRKNLGEILLVSAENPVRGADFSQKKQIISVDFEVIKAGKGEISYKIVELYDIYHDEDGAYVKRYTLTSDLLVNGEAVGQEEIPIVNNISEADYNGPFVNQKSGRGEDSGKPLDPSYTYVFETLADTKPPKLTVNNVDEKVDGKVDGDAGGDGDTKNIIITVSIVLLLAAVLVVIQLRRQKVNNVSESGEPDSENLD